MTEQEGFIQAIIDAPDEDPPRLRFAEWLAAGGRSAHAELIRVQCRLAEIDDNEPNAERARLWQREKELLGSAEFDSVRDLLESGSFRFVRGFIPEFPDGAEGYVHPDYSEIDREPDWLRNRDKILTIHYTIGSAIPDLSFMQKLANKEWFRRVTKRFSRF